MNPYRLRQTVTAATLAFWAAVAFVSCTPQPAAAACPDWTYESKPVVLTIDNSKSIAELAKLHSPGTLGVTVATMLGFVDEARCEVHWSVTPITVYVASELPAGTCGYAHILAHEMQHVAIYRNSIHIAPLNLRRNEDLGSFVRFIGAQHAAHDSVEEYAKNVTACSGSIARVYKHATR